jgi:hypothetical protein
MWPSTHFRAPDSYRFGCRYVMCFSRYAPGLERIDEYRANGRRKMRRSHNDVEKQIVASDNVVIRAVRAASGASIPSS